MLKCGHSFCTRYLWQLLTADDKIRCPTCGVEVNLSQVGVAGLPKNFALLSILAVKPQQKEGESLFNSEICDNKHPAIFWCFNCEEDMCKVAAYFHIRHKASNHHALIPLESATATAFCSKHSEPYRQDTVRQYVHAVIWFVGDTSSLITSVTNYHPLLTLL